MGRIDCKDYSEFIEEYFGTIEEYIKFHNDQDVCFDNKKEGMSPSKWYEHNWGEFQFFIETECVEDNEYELGLKVLKEKHKKYLGVTLKDWDTTYKLLPSYDIFREMNK